MGLFDLFRRAPEAAHSAPSMPRADAGGTFNSFDDPRLIELMRLGTESTSGQHVNVERALRNTSMFRAVSLISGSIGMLPLHLIDDETKAKQNDHPLFRLLHREPNGWQSAYDFRSLMQFRALVYGNAYGLIVRSTDARTRREKPIRLIPLDPVHVTVKQSVDWSVAYHWQPPRGAGRIIPASEMFHLRGMSFDGLSGVSLVKQARDAIGLALAAELAGARIFKNGVLAGSTLNTPGKLSNEAFERLRQSLADKESAENAGKNLILEEGLEFKSTGSSAKDAQLLELRKLQVEEIARVMGVPRPLLMVDETSWGSGIEALGRFFVQYALGPWFEAWQQAVERSLLADDEKGRLAVKFNPGALLRGSTKDQGDFFAKALGAGGGPGFMSPNEVRGFMDLPPREGGDEISKGAMGHNGGAPLNDNEVTADATA